MLQAGKIFSKSELESDALSRALARQSPLMDAADSTACFYGDAQSCGEIGVAIKPAQGAAMNRKQRMLTVFALIAFVIFFCV